MTLHTLKQHIASLSYKDDFDALALTVLRYQAEHNKVYRKYLDLLKKTPQTITKIAEIPFLPISFFKNHIITGASQSPSFFFQSSGTTGMLRSRHYIDDVSWYLSNAECIFSQFYGSVEDFCFFALLPSYLEQQHSSLVAMANHFIEKSNCRESRFFLNEYEQLAQVIRQTEGKRVLLLGVSYALMDFADYYNRPLPENVIVMETGGMKGRREELSKQDLHGYLSRKFHTTIHSEYGMTELMSQAYSKAKGIFERPPQMKLLIRDRYDPFSYLATGKTGGINIIDLANIDSCSFIETEDLGRLHDDKHFELLGRLEESDIRGCNLLIES
jgi:phenylacetate-coenzyme A ligase PaaK-like adenylate-forming protein